MSRTSGNVCPENAKGNAIDIDLQQLTIGRRSRQVQVAPIIWRDSAGEYSEFATRHRVRLQEAAEAVKKQERDAARRGEVPSGGSFLGKVGGHKFPSRRFVKGFFPYAGQSMKGFRSAGQSTVVRDISVMIPALLTTLRKLMAHILCTPRGEGRQMVGYHGLD